MVFNDIDKTTDGPSTTSSSDNNVRVAMQATTANNGMASSMSPSSSRQMNDATFEKSSLSSSSSMTKTRDVVLNKSNNVAPIIIGAGQGTTGTHFFTQVTCQLGYTSIHYNAGCIPNKQRGRRQVQVVGRNHSQTSPQRQEEQKTLNDTTSIASSSSSDTVAVPKLYKNLQYNLHCLVKQLRALWSSELSPASYRNQTLDFITNYS
jgi:hypothetical protein